MELKSRKGRIPVEQLSLKGLLEPIPRGGGIALDETTIEDVVILMAEAITAVFQEGGVPADDEPGPKL
jgi:hypothetical protein